MKKIGCFHRLSNQQPSAAIARHVAQGIAVAYVLALSVAVAYGQTPGVKSTAPVPEPMSIPDGYTAQQSVDVGGHATTLNAVRRHGDFVIADCPANCLQPWLQNDNGWDQGQVFFTPDMVWGMPPYYAQKLLSEDRLPLRVAADASSGLDVIATRSTDGRSVVVTAVNLDSHPTTTSVILEHFQVGSVSAKSVSGDLTAANSPSLPSKVTTKKLQTALHQNVVEIALPAHSVNSIRLIGASGRSL